MKKLLFDTDVLIEYLRGKAEAKKYIDTKQGVIYMSAITMAELYAGVREDEEYKKLERFIETFEVINLNKSIAKTGGLFRNKYKPSHGTGLADALIAATAQEISAQVVTFNIKHFPMFSDVIKPYEKP
jgi:predicted nucleic acid-binding protein